MSKHHKTIGINTEREVCKILKEKGFYVTRAAGSLGLFDVWAVNNKEIKLIQVKSVHKKKNYKLTFKSEIDKMKELKCIGNKEFWIRYISNEPTKNLIDKFEIIKLS